MATKRESSWRILYMDAPLYEYRDLDDGGDYWTTGVKAQEIARRLAAQPGVIVVFLYCTGAKPHPPNAPDEATPEVFIGASAGTWHSPRRGA